MTYLVCSYITENGTPSKETFHILSSCVDIKNNKVKREIKVIIDGRRNLLPPGLLLYIHELVRN
jgi:hypothetical protein